MATLRSLPGIAAVAAAIGDAICGRRNGSMVNLDINTLAAVMGVTPAFTGAVQGTVQAGMSELVSLKRFGAKGDGTTDDTLAMLRAKDSECGMVLMTPGTYKCDELLWDKETHLFGMGSTQCVIKSVTSTSGLILRPPSAGSHLTMRGFTLDGTSNTQPVGNYPGLLLQRKLYGDDIIVQKFKNDGCYMAPYDADIATAAAGTVGNAAFFCDLRNMIFQSNGRHGLWTRMGFNAETFTNCQYNKNTIYGLLQSTDGGSTYGSSHTGGQASYNGDIGYNFASGTNVNTRALYSEYNGSPGHTNQAGDAYSVTPYDIAIGNTAFGWYDVGTLLGGSNATKDSHISLPTFNPDRIQVWECARKLYGN